MNQNHSGKLDTSDEDTKALQGIAGLLDLASKNACKVLDSANLRPLDKVTMTLDCDSDDSKDSGGIRVMITVTRGESAPVHPVILAMCKSMAPLG